MKELQLNYVVHFYDLVGKPREIFESSAENALELVNELDGLYPGIKKLLIKPDGSAVPQNAMIYSRKGMRAQFVKDFAAAKLESGDYITFL